VLVLNFFFDAAMLRKIMRGRGRFNVYYTICRFTSILLFEYTPQCMPFVAPMLCIPMLPRSFNRSVGATSLFALRIVVLDLVELFWPDGLFRVSTSHIIVGMECHSPHSADSKCSS
jgi:hypothetical protein